MAMIDSGATGSFIDQELVKKHNIPLKEKLEPIILQVVDGRTISSGAVTHNTEEIQLQINNHEEPIQLDVTNLGYYTIILGIPWLEHNDPIISWSD
jgi:hypothetical protein